MRSKAVLACAALVCALAAAPALQGGIAPPDRIALPNGFQPEGIATRAGVFYVGSIPTGAIYRGSPLTGEGAILVPGRDGRSATGIAVAHGLVFVSGGATGMAYVYDETTGADVAALTLTTATSFVNDVVVTRDAAWFTDSMQAVLYRVPLEEDGSPGGQSEVETVPLTGDFQLEDGFNANGIDATPNGRRLVIVQSNTGKLFTVDAGTGETEEIDLGGRTLPNGDGVLLEGRRLFVVQNQQETIALVRLGFDLASGAVLRTISDDAFDVPTSIDRGGPWLYVVNARFGTEATPDTPYWITRVRAIAGLGLGAP